MDLARAKLFAYLDTLGIASTTVEHDAMFTVEQSQALRGTIPGAHTKNLFLRDKDNRLVLVVAKEDTTVDLKALAKKLGLGRFSFGRPEQMRAVLGVEPGSVTALALMNEGSKDLAAVVVDEALMAFAEVNCHPLDNRATTRLALADLLRFMRACGHEPQVLPLQ
ncbi:prolyl-tRNA synthetase associated domain-containing protein [Methyloceanibacter caenitepidi]|uniref:Similarity to aminoacyl-tRNA editing enzymes YbaK, ProX n=1 Tax=Methyloceanibacter caenitepidi TaxID=1384459 RepID=A0A0A8JZI3_9HYPH|nr:prolyl-tRNA synthetase associated domain-containing protein [Methyloceanibacter caenitepidi]BAQ15821.1 similarity to aminoacyl-tRNA editing enzymes YbaK, ProX [Methyloceanibacter caenitepidi]